MSEYQYYEFQAIDRPLTEREMEELRSTSGRATITPARFVNVYNWGDFKGDASRWMEKYFDAFLYLANWGTHDFRLRFSCRVLRVEEAKRYCCGESAVARAKGESVILEFQSDDEEGGRWVNDDEGSEWLSSLIPLRADIADGDSRALYLAWLLCAQGREVDGDAIEPPVPSGLRSLTAPLKAFAEFLRIDGDLIAAAAEHSPEAEDRASREELERWVAGLPDAEKTGLLVRLAAGEEIHVRGEILRRFRETRRVPDVTTSQRTVAELLAAGERRAEERRREEAERAAREKARREREEAEARGWHLDELAKREVETWQQVDALIATKNPRNYDEAVKLLGDLRDLGVRGGRAADVGMRIRALREQHARKPTFLERLRMAGLAEASS